MADNLKYAEPVTGQPVATDDVSGIHYQRVKLDVGTDGKSVPITGSTLLGIPVEVRSLPIDSVTVSGTVTGPKWAVINATLAGDTTVLPGVPGKRLRVLAITFSPNKNLSLMFKSGASTIKIPAMLFSQGIPLDVNRMPYGYFVETDPGDSLVINLSTNGNVIGSLTYIEV